MTNRQNLWLALTMAIKSLMAHRVKTVIVGSLLVLGTVLVTCGIALLDNVEQSISRSVIESLAGHLQIYDAHAQDKLAIYGDGSGGMPNVGEIESFKALLDSVEDFDNVDALIPMGVNIASMNRGNALERRLATWRKEMGTESLSARRLRITQVKDLLAELKSELTNQIELTDEIRRQELKAPLDHINSTESEDFWSRCLEDPTDALELIDTQIAPFAGNGRVLYLRYVGTDFKRFHRYFARFKLVEGRLIPPGERGMLINQTFADARLKLLPARLLDKLAESANEDVRIEDSLDLKSQARRLLTQVKSVTRLLPPESVQPIVNDLKRALPNCPTDLDALLTCLFDLTSEKVLPHHRLFYEVIAPHIELYPFEIGKTMTLKSFTKSGFPKAANIKVWGTYYFKGLENSMLSGAANLVDLDTFRELYGVSTAAQRIELAEMKADSGAVTVDRAGAEAMLFGDEGDVETEVNTPNAVTKTVPPPKSGPMDLVQNAAVFLSDVSRLDETKDALNAYFKAEGLPYQVIDWKEASGLIGQLAVLIRAILVIALIIIFGVAVIIINNSMVMATLERIREIGTMRAIGAQRNFMLLLVMLESLVIALISGFIGMLFSLFIFLLLGEYGIPATNEVAKFFFSGPRLYPLLEISHLLYGLLTVTLIGLAATYYPARIAIRVKPIEAMSGAE